jgi:hypothetical protein
MKMNFKCSLLFVILYIFTSCGTSDPSTKFKGKRFSTLEVQVFGIKGRQNIYFSETGNNLATYNTNDGGSNNGTWEFIDEKKKKINIKVDDDKYYWRSGIWEFSDDYTSITHVERDELYLKQND